MLALKGRNRRADRNLVSPFQGEVDSRSDPIPRALPWALLFRPLRGGGTAQHQKAPARDARLGRRPIRSRSPRWRVGLV